MSCDLWDSIRSQPLILLNKKLQKLVGLPSSSRILLLEFFNDQTGLLLGLLLYNGIKILSFREVQLPTVHINKGKVGTREYHSLAHNKTQTARSTGDDANMAVERKGRQGGLHILATSARDRLTARELMVLGILNLDLRISLGVFSRFVLTRREIVKLSHSKKGEGRAKNGRGSSTTRTEAQSRCKRHG